ncbi:MAG: hypothetical protein HYY34_04485 [Chloroflexi bacterium]|nr:hypothetical protein [Chloroflexota bacterium]
MAKRRGNARTEDAAVVEAQADEPRFVIDFDAMEAAGRSAVFFVRSRMCADAQKKAEGAKQLKDCLKLISSECAGKPEFIGPSTPLSEAVFRLILAANNRPLSIRDIQDGLTEAWSSVIYMKDLSEELLTRLLDRPNSYFIKRTEPSRSA